ncbi:MAG: hypothetical protein AB1505_34500 [Candidatus Latescibacterota bacterium]
MALGAVALLPLTQMGNLAWPQYARLWVAAPGLGYLLWRYLRRGATPAPGLVGLLVTLGFVYGVHQFGGQAAAAPLLTAVVGLSLVAALGGLLSAGSLRLTRADAVAAAAAFILVLPGGGKALAGGQRLPWDLLARAGASLLLWFAVTRTLRVSPGAARAVARTLVGVLAVVAAYGAGQVASVPLSRLRGDSARTAGDLDQAARLFDSGRARAGRLGLEGMADGLAFQLAAVLQAQGHSDQAAATLGLQPGFVQVIPADAWEGPEGGNLDYHQAEPYQDRNLRVHQAEIRYRQIYWE